MTPAEEPKFYVSVSWIAHVLPKNAYPSRAVLPEAVFLSVEVTDTAGQLSP